MWNQLITNYHGIRHVWVAYAAAKKAKTRPTNPKDSTTGPQPHRPQPPSRNPQRTNKQEHPSHPTSTKPRTTSTPLYYTHHKWYRLSCVKCTIHRVLVTQPKPQKEQENDPHIAARMKHELLYINLWTKFYWLVGPNGPPIFLHKEVWTVSTHFKCLTKWWLLERHVGQTRAYLLSLVPCQGPETHYRYWHYFAQYVGQVRGWMPKKQRDDPTKKRT